MDNNKTLVTIFSGSDSDIPKIDPMFKILKKKQSNPDR